MSRDDGSTQALDSPANERIRRWEWLSERIGWLAMITILAAACLGLLGKGPVSKRSLATDDGVVRVAFDAVARRDAPTKFDSAFAGQPPQSRSGSRCVGLFCRTSPTSSGRRRRGPFRRPPTPSPTSFARPRRIAS